MTIFVDECRWPFQGRLWCHCISDTDLGELHRFVRFLGVPRRGFQGDHYDLPEPVRAGAIARGARAVSSRELLARLKDAGLRLSPTQRRAAAWSVAEVRLDPARWLGQVVEVVVDRPFGSSHLLSGGTYPVNLGVVSTDTAAGEHLDAYVLGPRRPVSTVSAPVVAVIRRHDDVDDRLVVAASGAWDAASIGAVVHDLERWFAPEVITDA